MNDIEHVKLGQRWLFDNSTRKCSYHVSAKFIVEVIRSDYDNLEIIQVFDKHFRLGQSWHGSFDQECYNGCYTYLIGQDVSKA